MRVFKDNEELKSLIKDGSIIIEDDIRCNFNIDVCANIDAWDINALNINARNIKAMDINAMDIKAMDINAWDINAMDIKAMDINAMDINSGDIKARDISYYAFCMSYYNIECESIEGRRGNSLHKCLDGKLTIKEKLKEVTIKDSKFMLSSSEINELKKQL